MIKKNKENTLKCSSYMHANMQPTASDTLKEQKTHFIHNF